MIRSGLLCVKLVLPEPALGRALFPCDVIKLNISSHSIHVASLSQNCYVPTSDIWQLHQIANQLRWILRGSQVISSEQNMKPDYRIAIAGLQFEQAFGVGARFHPNYCWLVGAQCLCMFFLHSICCISFDPSALLI